jgi:hypothetical protein
MPKPLKPSLKSIVAAASPGAGVQRTVVELPQPVRSAPARAATLKERAKQLSVYLEPEVYDQLRDIAYTERTKIHSLMLEGLDLLFRDRGAKSVRDLEARK